MTSTDSQRLNAFQNRSSRLPTRYRSSISWSRYQRSRDSHQLRYARSTRSIYPSSRSYSTSRKKGTVSTHMLYSCPELIVRSITLVGEADRKMLKAAIKQSSADQIRHRIIPNEAIIAMSENLAGLTDEIQEILHEEKEEKLVRLRDIASIYANK
jgi:hypothetical protein